MVTRFVIGPLRPNYDSVPYLSMVVEPRVSTISLVLPSRHSVEFCLRCSSLTHVLRRRVIFQYLYGIGGARSHRPTSVSDFSWPSYCNPVRLSVDVKRLASSEVCWDLIAQLFATLHAILEDGASSARA